MLTSEEAPGEINEEEFITNATTLTELMFDHKQAFEAESSEAALPALKRLCQARQDEETKPSLEGQPLGDWIKHLLDWEEGQEYKKPFPEGRWRDGTRTFHRGTTIEIKPHVLGPEEGSRSRRNSVQTVSSVTSLEYVRGHTDSEDQLYAAEQWPKDSAEFSVKRRSTGQERQFRVKATKDPNILCIEDFPNQWILEAVPTWDRWRHYAVLERVWGEMTAARIGKILAVLESACANRFLHALAVKVPGSLMGTLALQSNPALKNHVTSFHGPFGKCSSVEDFSKVPDRLKRSTSSKSSGWIFSQSIKRTKVVLYFSGVDSLLRTHQIGGSGLCSNLDHVEFLFHLTDLPDEAKPFTTPLGQAAAANCWDLAAPMFAGNRVMDFAVIAMLTIFLSPSTYSFHSNQPVLPKQWQILLVVLLLSWGATTVLVEFAERRAIGSGRPPEAHDYFRNNYRLPMPPKLFTLARVLLELYSLYWAWRLIVDYFVRHWKFPESVMIHNSPYMGDTENELENTTNSCLGIHPVGLGALIFAKWLQLTMASLNVPLLRSTLGTMLPVWYAIKSRESIACLGYMLCLTCGCALSLLGLPYNTYFHSEAGELKSFLKAFLHMFRINFMSDFDMAHFEKEKVLPPCIQIYVCLMAFLFPVILLNVYVGVVSGAYDKFKDNLTQISCDYMVESTLKEVLQQYFWGKRCRCIFCPVRCSACHSTSQCKDGLWICMPAQFMEDPVQLAS